MLWKRHFPKRIIPIVDPRALFILGHRLCDSPLIGHNRASWKWEGRDCKEVIVTDRSVDVDRLLLAEPG